ncbi:dephospho-CoA kinase [Zhaonella formicivorans]|uniref:dephospho-CoA kinase n=1 Tax=Zhaonella formicivorans TaxID=2528593 RepID=UPI0010D5C990|nr:dephospho-CoA kinase [Zhaonella formicivorans]
MLVVGLTGGIASGKSTVSKKLVSLGAKLVDADQIAREVVRQGQPAWQEITSHFGQNILLESGEINRKTLAEIVFNNSEARAFLMHVTHPRILNRSAELIEEYRQDRGTKLIVLDAPLLIESGAHRLVEQIWVVFCSLETQVRRLMARDNLSRGQALARIKAQMPLEEKLRYADEVINTEGTKAQTLEQVEKLWLKYAL